MGTRNIWKKEKYGRTGSLTLTLVLVATMVLTMAMTGCDKRVTKIDRASTAMGTIISQTVYVNVTGFGASARGEQVTDDITQILSEIDETYSWRKDTAWIARINATAGAEEGYKLTPAQSRELETLLQLCKQTEGAFDISLGALTKLWNIDQKVAGVSKAGVPSEEEIQQALLTCGYDKVQLRGEEKSENQNIHLPSGMSLDLGGVAKGIAGNQVLSYLESNEDVHGTVISLGGNVITYGDRGDGSSWNIGIVNPLNPDTNIGYLTLKGSHMVITSGDYERFFEVDGQRFHHILDPETGYPADAGIKSVTVWCQDGIVGDALSTACFVVGVDRALELAGEYGVEILIVTDEGKLIMTEGMEKVFTKQ